MSQTLKQRRILKSHKKEVVGDVIAAVCVILIPFVVVFIGAAF